ncbi:MAG TPA: hypothetical protein VHB79_12540 [Polyangiaceae bacterium]|nr:hypothetical protein [Polyangiaceae bacterium]
MPTATASPQRPEPSAAERYRLAGRRWGIAAFGGIFASATLWWTVQILTTVWGGAPPSPAGCAGGTASLLQAVERARDAYEQKAGEEDERTALARYRGALEPEWSDRKGIEAACKGDATGEKHLKDVIALRYAEEHAVRYESLGLAPLRRRLQGTRGSPNDLNR